MRRGDTPRGERGAISAEHVVIVLVIAAVVTALVRAAIPERVEQGAEHATCALFNGDCDDLPAAADGADVVDPARGGGHAPGPFGRHGAGPVGGAEAATESDDVSDASRRDAARGASRDRRDADEDGDEDADDGETPAPTTSPAPSLGEPVDGTDVSWPDPQDWSPVDAGAGPYDSQSPGLRQLATRLAAEAAANLAAGRWPDASRNLLHFLDNQGDPLEQDVDRMLDEVAEFHDEVDAAVVLQGETAIAEAMERDPEGPVTFPLASAWNGFGYDADGALVYDNSNWFYALGGWQYSLVGEVTVHPPTTSEPEWRYTFDGSVHVRDQYNWDGGKATTIGPFEVTDEELAELHRAGLAQEYTALGTSTPITREGTW